MSLDNLVCNGDETVGPVVSRYEEVLFELFPEKLRRMWEDAEGIGGKGKEAARALVDNVVGSNHRKYTAEQVQAILDNSLRGQPDVDDQDACFASFERGEIVPTILTYKDFLKPEAPAQGGELKTRLLSKAIMNPDMTQLQRKTAGIKTMFPFIIALQNKADTSTYNPELLRQLNLLELQYAVRMHCVSIDVLEPLLYAKDTPTDIAQILDEHPPSGPIGLELVEFLSRLADGEEEVIARLKEILALGDFHLLVDDFPDNKALQIFEILALNGIHLDGLKFGGLGTHALAGNPNAIATLATCLSKSVLPHFRKLGEQTLQDIKRISQRNTKKKKSGMPEKSTHTQNMIEVRHTLFGGIFTEVRKHLEATQIICEGDKDHPIFEKLLPAVKAGTLGALDHSGAHGQHDLNSILVSGPIEKEAPLGYNTNWLYEHNVLPAEEPKKQKRGKGKQI